ncbi:MAG: hypothetical protein K9M08_09960 [Pirellula sp.]|nr:hypothetical protein [Pirellula sp.]
MHNQNKQTFATNSVTTRKPIEELKNGLRKRELIRNMQQEAKATVVC